MGFKNWINKVTDTIMPGTTEMSQTETQNESQSLSSTSSRTIVIVEDEEITRKILESTIKKLGYECKCFSEAKSAFDFLKQNKKNLPYLIISDLMMDEGDGIDLLAQTRDDRSMNKIPFVFLTGANKDLFQGILANYQYDGFLNKPINTSDLSSLLERFGAVASTNLSQTKVA